MRINASDFSSFSHALIIGINSYHGGSLSKLESPVPDTSKLYDAFINKYGCSIPEDNVTLFQNSIDKESILKKLSQTTNSLGPSEMLIFYFAGHGIHLDGEFFLCLGNTNMENILSTAIAGSEIDQCMKNFNGRGIILIFDCCESAGVAEHAPNAFRQLKDNEFRLLLSSSRKNQNSWELPKSQGTIFTNVLLNTLNGVEVAGTNGLIYFSDLFNHLQNRVAEEVEINYKNLPRQEPIFAGIYSQDPLLFVHRGQTLRKISLKTIRYSKAQVRKIIGKILLVTVALISFVCGVLYSSLEKHEFVALDQKQLRIFQGYPGWNIFGFPKKKWVLNVTLEDLKDNSPIKSGKPVAGDLASSVIPVLFKELKPYKTAELLISSQRQSDARSLLIQAVHEDHRTDLKQILTQWATIMQPADTALFIHLFKSQDVSLYNKQFLLGLISKFAPTTSIALASCWKLNPVDDTYTLRNILVNIRVTDTLGISSYLSDQLKTPDVVNFLPHIVAFSTANQLKLNERSLSIVARNIHNSDGAATGNYIRTMKFHLIQNYLKNYLDSALKVYCKTQNSDITYNMNWALSVLQKTASSFSCNYYEQFLTIKSPVAFHILLQNCPQNLAKLNSNDELKNWMLNDPEVLKLLAQYHLISLNELIDAYKRRKFNPDGDRILTAIGYLHDKNAIPFLINLARYDEKDISPGDRNREVAISVLKQLDKNNAVMTELKEDPWENIQTLGYQWSLELNYDETMIEIAKLLLNDHFSIVSDILSSHRPSPAFLKIMRDNLSSQGISRLNAARVIAMYAEPKEIIPLLNDPELEFRKTVGEYAAFNNRAEEIYDHLIRQNEFPNEQCQILSEQILVKKKLVSACSALSHGEDNKWLRDLLSDLYKDELHDGLFDYINYAF